MAACAAVLAALLPAWAQADWDPANSPPFGGERVPATERPGSQRVPPPGFQLSAADAIAIAGALPEVQSELDEGLSIQPIAVTRGPGLWEVRYQLVMGADGLRGGRRHAIVYIDDSSGDVIDAFTDEQIETPLTRGYPGAVAGKANSWWIWIPLCLLFLAPFVDPRRPLRLLHFDLLVLLGLSVSLFFFNRAEIEASVLLVYPVLAYVFLRMAGIGFDRGPGRGAGGPLLPFARRRWLLAAIAVLAVFHVGYQATEGKVIDVGIASVIGADRLMDGDDVYGDEFGSELPESGDVRGDVYGPVNYEAYVPFELALAYEDEWDEVPAAQAGAVAFTLLTALALFALGRRLREGEEGTTLGIALAFAWLAYPFTLYTAASSFNDSLVALLVVCSLLAAASPPARGALAALAGLTKFGPLVLTPLLAAGKGERDRRSLALFAAAFAAVALAVTLPALPDGGFKELYDRSLGYQASRGSPFSLWGQAPGLDFLHTASKVFAVVFGAALFFVPRTRTLVQLAALAAAALIAVQVTASHWFYPYAVWFVPLALAAVFALHAGARPERR